MHSNNMNFLAEFVGRMSFGVQIQTKPVVPFQNYKTSAKTTQSKN
jgi:hypothetical protein